MKKGHTVYKFNAVPMSAKNENDFCNGIEFEIFTKNFFALTSGFHYATMRPTIKEKFIILLERNKISWNRYKNRLHFTYK